MKIFEIYNELILEGTIKLPKEVTDKFKPLFDEIKNNLEKAVKFASKNYRNPYILYKDYFKFKGLNNNDINISIGLYNDDKDKASARMNANDGIFIINMAKFDKDDYDEFSDTFYHELVHSSDPLVQKTDVYNKYYEKRGSEPMGSGSEYEKSYEKYRKSQHEYVAFLSPFVEKVRGLIGNDDKKLEWIIWIISNISRFDSPEDLYSATHQYIENMKEIGLFSDEQKYWVFLYKVYHLVKPWTNKPQLYKKFLKDLYNGVKNK